MFISQSRIQNRHHVFSISEWSCYNSGEISTKLEIQSDSTRYLREAES